MTRRVVWDRLGGRAKLQNGGSEESFRKTLKKKMVKHANCCVPGCTNNYRTKDGLSHYRIPKDKKLRKQYKILIRNATLKIDADNTCICGDHFEGGHKRSRLHLPSIFPWSKHVETRRILKRVSSEKIVKKVHSEGPL